MAHLRGKISVLFLVIFILILAGCAAAPQNVTSPIDKGDEMGQQSAPSTENNSDSPKAGVNPSSTNSGSSSDTSNTENQHASEKTQPIGELEVHYIDVGQGGSQLLIGPTGKTMLIDAGKNNMEETVVGYLKNLDITKVDILIGTHPDADHTGGLDKVIDNFDIGKIYMPKVQSNTQTFESVLLAVQMKGLKVTTAKAGLTLDWEPGIDVKMIAPVSTYDDANEMSAVIHMTHGQTSFLFTGDAESKSEDDMIGSGVDLKSDVLLIGHHGSNTSTSQEFLDKVNPTYAIIQSGEGNSYGHPTDEVLNRLLDKGIKIFRNDSQGNVVFTSNGKEISVAQNPWKNTAGVEDHTKEVVPIPQIPQNPDTSTGDLKVSASIDDASPKQNSTVAVTVKVQDGSGKTVNGAEVKLILHYKSTDTVYEGKTNADGVSTLSFKIGRAAKGFTVDGDISVNYGDKSSKAQVSFTPK